MKPSMPSFSLSWAMRSAACILSKVALSMVSFSISNDLGLFRIELARQIVLHGVELVKQMRRDGQQVASGQLADLADIAEARAHDDRLVAESLEVVVNLGDGLHAGVVGALVVLAGVLLVPVEDAADEGRDQRDAGLGAGDGLVQCRRAE